MKENLTAKEICQIAGFSQVSFYELKKKGIIPPADDCERKPHTWKSDNPQLIEFFKSRNIEL